MAKSQNLIYYINDLITEEPSKEFFLSTNPDAVLVEVSRLDPSKPKSTETLRDYVESNSSAVWNPQDIQVLSIGSYGSHPFKGTMIYVGRNTKSDIVIYDLKASRTHARFVNKNDIWSIIDESSNGTFINHQKISKGVEYKLNSGNNISFGGDSEYEFYTPNKFWDFLNFRADILRRSLE